MSEYTSERTLGELISFSTLSTTVDPEQQLKDGMVLPRGRGLARGGGRAEKVELDEHVNNMCMHMCSVGVCMWGVGGGMVCASRPVCCFSLDEPVSKVRCSTLVQ